VVRVVFLDFDGVLNSRASRKRCPGVELDPFHVKFLNRITEVTGAVITISSSWRMAPDAIPQLVGAGATAAIAGTTPDLMGQEDHYSQTRCTEIQQWLAEHPEVTGYVILDDLGPDVFEPIKDRLIHTKDGLLAEHVQPAIENLLRPYN